MKKAFLIMALIAILIQFFWPYRILNTPSLLYYQTPTLMIHYCKDSACVDLRDGQKFTVLLPCIPPFKDPIIQPCFYWQAYPWR